MTTHDCFLVRYKGHLCAAVQTGLCRKPLLLRRRKDEPIFVERYPISLGSEEADGTFNPERWRLRALVACARAIKRTDRVRRKLLAAGDNHMLRGVASVERLLRTGGNSRRGKRWKIVPAHSSTLTAAPGLNEQSSEATKT